MQQEDYYQCRDQGVKTQSSSACGDDEIDLYPKNDVDDHCTKQSKIMKFFSLKPCVMTVMCWDITSLCGSKCNTCPTYLPLSNSRIPRFHSVYVASLNRKHDFKKHENLFLFCHHESNILDLEKQSQISISISLPNNSLDDTRLYYQVLIEHLTYLCFDIVELKKN